MYFRLHAHLCAPACAMFSQEYDPQLANKTLLGSGDVVPDSRQSQKTEYDNRQLLIELVSCSIRSDGAATSPCVTAVHNNNNL